MPDIYDIAEANKRALLATERRALVPIINAYALAYRRIQARVEQLTSEIDAGRADGVLINTTWLFERDRMLRLQDDIELELARFSRVAANRVASEQRESYRVGVRDARVLLETADIEVDAELSALNPRAVEAVAGFASDASPLRVLFDDLGFAASKGVRETLIAGVAEGVGVRTIAARIKDDLGGNLARAMTISRTETIRAYREANHEVYKQHATRLEGWTWSATLSVRTCAMCWAMHGRVFPVESRLRSHPSCRCVAVPLRRGAKRVETGTEAFSRLEAGAQLAVLGKGKFEAFRSGAFGLPDIVGERADARWGLVRYEKPLYSLMNSRGMKETGDSAFMTDMKIGAGGYWKTIDEKPDPSVPKQSNPLACVAATGEMLLKSRGVVVTQETLLAKIDSPSHADKLAEVMTELDTSEGFWQGEVVSHDSFGALNRTGTWGAVLREGSPMGHMVMISGRDTEGLIKVSDPYPLTEDDTHGTSYKMTIEEFMNHWAGEAVFKQ